MMPHVAFTFAVYLLTSAVTAGDTAAAVQLAVILAVLWGRL